MSNILQNLLIPLQNIAPAIQNLNQLLQQQQNVPAPQPMVIQAPAPQVNIPQPMVNVNVPQPMVNVNVPPPNVNVNVPPPQVNTLGIISKLEEQRVIQEQMQESLIGQSATMQEVEQGVGRQLETMNNVASYMNPYLNADDEELKAEFRRLGLSAFQSLVDTDRFRAMRKLNMVQEMDGYADEILKYNQGQSKFADQAFERRSFDLFVKTTKVSKRGTPLEQTYRYLPSSIPESHIKFTGKMYELNQGGSTKFAKNFRDIERIALKGGDYSDELTVFREIKQIIDKRKTPQHVIFKARKW